MKFIRTALPYLVAIFAIVFSASALAQYMWLDASGRKVFSDQPPPANIPAKRILQQPGKASAAPVASSDTEEKPIEGADAAAKSAAKSAEKPAATEKIVSKDKDLEAAKKKIDDEAAAKKKAEQEKNDVAKADNCKRAKQAKSQFETGRPVATANAKGERIIMDEAARMVETKRLEGIITSDCK